MFPQRVIAADALVTNEGLWRGVDIMLGLEGVSLLARGQMMICDRIALGFEQPFRLDAIGTDMFGHHHPVKRGRFL